MANRRYDQFPAGTYDTSKIFLQADATTGELEKVNLPSLSGASSQTGLFKSVGGSPTQFCDFNIDSASMIVVGKMLRITAWFQSVGADTRSVSLRVDTNTIYTVNANTAGYYKITFDLIPIDGSNVAQYIQHYRGGSSVGFAWATGTNANYTSDPVLNILLTSNNNDSIELYGQTIEVLG